MADPIQPADSIAPQDEFLLDTPQLRTFIGDVRRTIAEGREVSATLDALQPSFEALLADAGWLPAEFAAPHAASGMGGGIASWLLYRAADRSLSLISLVVPPDAETPVHDHLAWGFVGLYRGEQRETVYARRDGLPTMHAHEHGHEHDDAQGELEHAVLDVIETKDLKPGDLYRLLPPDGDIHAVKTISAEPSISIHLLTNDIGCVVRHAYDPAQATARAFRSGYANVACVEDESPTSAPPGA